MTGLDLGQQECKTESAGELMAFTAVVLRGWRIPKIQRALLEK